MNALQEFKFNENSVRVVMVGDQPHWVLSDVCKILGLVNPSTVATSVEMDDLSSVEVIDSMNRTQYANAVNESGLYQVIFISRKPEAKAFRKWVTSEVLPQIRKTGSYSLPTDPVDQVLLLCEKLTATALQVKEERLKVAALEHHINIDLKPKVDGWNEFIGCDGLVELNHVAQICKTGRNTLFKKLRDEKVFYYKGAYNSVYQQYVDAGYFEMRMVPNEELGPIPVIKCTPKGAEWIYNKFYRKAA